MSTIPKEAEPDVKVPIIYVQLTQRGISPEDSERLLLKVVETQLKQVSNVKEMRSTALTLILKYKEGETKVLVPPGTPVVAYASGDKSDLKVGAKIFIGAAKKLPDGSLEAGRVNVGRGVAPPM